MFAVEKSSAFSIQKMCEESETYTLQPELPWKSLSEENKQRFIDECCDLANMRDYVPWQIIDAFRAATRECGFDFQTGSSSRFPVVYNTGCSKVRLRVIKYVLKMLTWLRVNHAQHSMPLALIEEANEAMVHMISILFDQIGLKTDDPGNCSGPDSFFAIYDWEEEAGQSVIRAFEKLQAVRVQHGVGCEIVQD